jgi:multiple sugar transport system ATP-binding protein
MARVELEHVTKVFPGGTVAVDDVSLDVSDGEFMVLVGPSGCGKSTLLRMVAGLEEITRGTIAIDGEVVNDLAPKMRDIAMVFQNYALYPHMTVAENLGFSLRIRHESKENIHQRVSDVCHVLGLDPFTGRKPKALSGGQRQRVAMGRAIVRRPRVFLMDEPLSNLDAKLRVAMRGELTRLHHRYETTTLYVTHDQIEAMTLGDRIAVLDAGRLQQVGDPQSLYDSPRNVFVAGFIGSPAMNLAPAHLADSAEGPVLILGEYKWPLPPECLATRPELRSYVGRDVVVGLRPHNIGEAIAGTDAGVARMRAQVITVEALGSERNVLFVPPFPMLDQAAGPASAEADNAFWTARVGSSSDARAEHETELAVDLRHAYFFDAATSEAILPRREHAPV